MITVFGVAHLDHLVRSSGDERLQRLIRLLHPAGLGQVGGMTDEQVEEFLTILHEGCGQNIRQSFDDLEDDVVRLVGKRKAQEELERLFEEKVRRNRRDCMQFKAEDFIDNNGTWAAGNINVTQKLNRNVLAKENLFVYPNARVRMTENNTVDGVEYSQGQAGIVREFVENRDGGVKIRISLIPPGEVYVEGNLDTYPTVLIGKRFTQEVRVGYRMQLARRFQYPVCLNIAATAHKVLGATIDKVAFRIQDESSMFGLWDRKQFLVMISRTRFLSNLYPVGRWEDLAAALRVLLKKDCAREQSVCDFLKSADVLRDNPRRIIERFEHLHGGHQLRELSGVYLRVTIDPRMERQAYIGQTNEFGRRFGEHTGSTQAFQGYVNPSRVRVFAIVIGFFDGAERRLFEQRWFQRAGMYNLVDVNDLFEAGVSLAQVWNGEECHRSNKITVVRCGRFVREQGQF